MRTSKNAIKKLNNEYKRKQTELKRIAVEMKEVKYYKRFADEAHSNGGKILVKLNDSMTDIGKYMNTLTNLEEEIKGGTFF